MARYLNQLAGINDGFIRLERKWLKLLKRHGFGTVKISRAFVKSFKRSVKLSGAPGYLIGELTQIGVASPDILACAQQLAATIKPGRVHVIATLKRSRWIRTEHRMSAALRAEAKQF